MKNKKLNYILIPAVIGLWALIIFRVMDGIDTADYSFIEQKRIPKNITTIKIEEDTFQLIAKYRDPFLGKVYQTRQTSKKRKKNKRSSLPSSSKQASDIKIKNQLAAIKYLGLIRNDKDKKIGLAQYAGNEKMILNNDSIGIFKIKDFDRKKLTLNFNKETFEIKK